MRSGEDLAGLEGNTQPLNEGSHGLDQVPNGLPLPVVKEEFGGYGRNRTYSAVRQRIYSPLQLSNSDA